MSIPDSLNQSEYADLDRWQAGCTPKQSTQLPGVDSLADGALDCEIIEAKLGATPNTQETIFRMVCRALTGPSAGLIFERPRFFRRQSDLDWLAGELMTLGFPADEWLKAQSFGRQLAAACPSLKGVRFSATKKTEEGDDGKHYGRMYVNARLHAAPMPQAATASAPLPTYDAPPAVTSLNTDDVPF